MRANGMVLAITGRMGIPNLDSLHAYLLAVDFKLRVYKLVDEHPEAKRDYLYVRQLFDALGSAEANIAEGWRRWIAGEVTQFLRYSLASLEEAKVRLKDGVHRGYFTMEECRETLAIGNRCVSKNYCESVRLLVVAHFQSFLHGRTIGIANPVIRKRLSQFQ